MHLDNAMIYRRTDSGVREVYEKSHQFTQSERLILILLDGRLNVGGVRSRLPSVNDERLARALKKLLAAGLVEPAASGTRLNGGSALKPDAVAQFLEQTDLDPITVVAVPDQGHLNNLDLTGLPVAAGGARLQTSAARSNAGGDALDITAARRSMGSGRLHEPRFSDTAWDPARATDFAITTINVPDRLDVQEVRAQADADEYNPRRFLPDSYTVGVWIKRLLALGIIGGLGYWAFLKLEPLRHEVSAQRIAQRLSAAAGQPVAVADTEWRFLPSPRFAVKGVSLPGGPTVPEVALLVNWRDVGEALRGGQMVWGEATIPEMTLSGSHAAALLRLLPGLSSQLPATISTLRLGSLRFVDAPLLPGRYEAVIRREGLGPFGPVEVRALDGTGAMRMILTPGVGESGNEGAEFRIDATRWRPPLGPDIRWSDVNVEGWVEPNLVLVRSFLASDVFGSVQGVAAAANDVEWVATALVRGSSIDLEALLQSLHADGPRDVTPGQSRVPAQGMASMELLGIGRGDSLGEALGGGELYGPVRVRWGILNGINLGYAATQGYSGGGITRFTELQAEVAGGGGAGLTVKNIIGRAGAMQTRGQFTVAPDLTLDGALRVELGATRVQAPLNLRVRGTALAPTFGR